MINLKEFKVGDFVTVNNPWGFDYTGIVIAKVPPAGTPNHVMKSNKLDGIKHFRNTAQYHTTFLVKEDVTNYIRRPHVEDIRLQQNEPINIKTVNVMYNHPKEDAAPVKSDYCGEYQIRYNENQVTAAAKFIFENNEHCSNWPSPAYSAYDVCKQIKEFIRQNVKSNILLIDAGKSEKWNSYASTGGFMITMGTDDDYAVDVEVYVDPSLTGSSNPYISVTELYDAE